MAIGDDRSSAHARSILRQQATDSLKLDSGRDSADAPTFGRGSSSIASGRSPPSVADSSARIACQFCSRRHSEYRLAIDPDAGRQHHPYPLRGGVTLQRSTPTPRAFHWRRVLNRQYLVDLDDAGRRELPILG